MMMILIQKAKSKDIEINIKNDTNENVIKGNMNDINKNIVKNNHYKNEIYNKIIKLNNSIN